jgi:hypothetical protein
VWINYADNFDQRTFAPLVGGEPAEAGAASRSIQKHVDTLRLRRDKLEEAFIYDKRIDKATYEAQKDKLNEDLALAEIEAHSAKLEALDIEGAVGFAEYLIKNAAHIWSEMGLDQKQRFQKVLFPEGLTFKAGKFGTAVTCIFFSMLQRVGSEKTNLASPMDSMLNSLIQGIQEIYSFRELVPLAG